MDNTATCSLVNGLLIEVHRSLLQYAAEASPWSSEADESLIQEILSLSDEQEKSVLAFVDFLRSSKWLIDFGVYPHEYTSLHFVGIDYFIARIQESEHALISELEQSLLQLDGGSEAFNVVQAVLQREKEIAKAVTDLSITNAT